MERIKQRLNSETSVKSTNTDVNLKINLEAKQKLLPPDKIDHVVDVGEQFNTERQGSSFYRVLGSINPLVTNVLFNLNNSLNNNLYTWAGFNTLEENNDLTYQQTIKKDLKEIEGWFGYFDPDISKSALCNFFDMEPKRERFSFLLDIAPYNCTSNCNATNNWNLTITYPATADTTHFIVKGGLFMFDHKKVTIAGRDMVAFGTPVLHNLSVGDTVRFTGTTFNDDYIVVRTGLDDGSLKGYYFVIDINPTQVTTLSSTSRMIKIVGGVLSNYYFRKFRKITTRNNLIISNSDYETYKLGFSENIYFDSLTQFVFNEDISVSGLTDNLGRPLSELYLTIIKTDSNKLFGNISSGIETPFMGKLTKNKSFSYLSYIPAINRIHNGGTSSISLPFPSHIPLEISVSGTNNNNIIGNNDYYGDVVEYNGITVKETILANVAHRFNTKNREISAPFTYTNTVDPITTKSINLGPRQEGYYYLPHKLIKIREFSSYIEQGDTHTGGIPDYAENLGDGRYLWRDLLDIGFNESDITPLDYPFLNGCHYMYQNISFNVRRQDAFDNWGLYWSNFPSDPIGESTPVKFITNSATNIC